jgi:hypothetical protein
MKIVSLQFTIILLFLISLSWFVQDTIYASLGDDWRDTEFLWEYGYNLSVSLVLGYFYCFIFIKFPDQLGFAFLGSISVKFILFFIFIYPEIRADEVISQVEFAGFFVPFSVCLFSELIFLIFLLRS